MPGPGRGSHRLADSSIPSRAGIRASQTVSTSWIGGLAGRPGGSDGSASAGRLGDGHRPSLRAGRVPGTPVRAVRRCRRWTSRTVTSGPWTRHARRIAYENPWITVWHDEVTRPDGSPGIYGVVHFANLAAGVLALDDRDRVLLVGQHRYALDAYSWEIPEGGVPDGETPLEGARRELREETGVDAADWRELARVHLSNSVSDELAVLFLATGLTRGAATPDATEASRSAGCRSTRSWR